MVRAVLDGQCSFAPFVFRNAEDGRPPPIYLPRAAPRGPLRPARCRGTRPPRSPHPGQMGLWVMARRQSSS
eukprot:2164272-Lingulodinium_polyedra.AAC.1